MTAPSVSLLPCPFCGKQPSSCWYGASGEDDDSGYWGIDCCKAHSHDDTEADAVEAWNTRATPPAPTPSGARERIARIIDPEAFEDDRLTWHDRRIRALAKADAILSTIAPDEAAIRADEREKCAAYHDRWVELLEKRTAEVEAAPNIGATDDARATLQFAREQALESLGAKQFEHRSYAAAIRSQGAGR